MLCLKLVLCAAPAGVASRLILKGVQGAEGVCFVNFQDYASAKSVEAAAKPGRREVRMHNALLTVSPARNTTFIDALLDDLRLHGLEEFDMAYAARVAADMPKDRWPPKAQDMARLCRQVGEHFVADVERPNMFLAIDVHGGASLGLSVVTRSTPTSSPRTSSPELSPDDRRAYKRRLAILTNFLHDNCDILQTVFNVVWQRARAKREEAEIIAELSQRGVEVGEWVYEWDIPMLCLAITTPSFNETLRQWDVLGDGCGHGGRLLASLEVLVRERVLREGDVEERYSTYIRQWRQGPLLATCTIRLVRNILCHRPGSCPGLSGAAFDELFWLARNAFGALVCVSAEEAEDIAALFQDRCKLAQDAAFADDDTFFDAASSVASVASAGSCMSEWPAPSGFEPLPGSRAAVAMWSKGTVLEFFAQKNFPTAGVEAGEIDGPALLELMDSPHAEALFTAPVPDGLGFNRIMYHGRFRSEFRAVCGDGGA